MISQEQAKRALIAAEKRAEQLGTQVSVAIVDEYGILVAFSRMDGAMKISPQFAYTKAYTAGTIGTATSDLAPYALPEKPYHGLNSIFGGELTTIAGGIPVKKGNKLVGGVGVGGSMDVSQDADCAKAAAKVLME